MVIDSERNNKDWFYNEECIFLVFKRRKTASVFNIYCGNW